MLAGATWLQISCSCFWLPCVLGSLGCRLVIIVSVPREQEPLGCRLILLSWEQGAQSRSYQWSVFVFRHHMCQGHQVQFDLSSLWSLRRSHQYLASFGIYVDSRLFAIFYSVFLASLMIISYAPSSGVALASGGEALSLVPHGGLWRFLSHLCWANTLVCL